MANSHVSGWPAPKGGAQSLANALGAYFTSLGGEIVTGTFVKALKELPPSKAVLLDVTPKQLLQIAGERFTSFYKWQLKRYKYGMGVFKVDWALDGPVPFTAAGCREAGTIHLGNTIEEIAANEQRTVDGQHPELPYTLFVQHSIFDKTRAPEGKHTAWGYCHVPNGSTKDMTAAIENQVERFAPGFKDLIIGRHVMNTADVEAYNPNYIGGDINGGLLDITQLYTRPAMRWSPYTTPAKGIYVCSSSTPPGGGIHGMCGYHAAKKALRDVFGVRL
jgi:phytoene dehydrogenase-like protein